MERLLLELSGDPLTTTLPCYELGMRIGRLPAFAGSYARDECSGKTTSLPI